MKKLLAVVLISVGILGAQAANAAEDCINFNPSSVAAKKVSGSWKVVDGNHWMFDFGNKRSEARKTARIIKHYRMNKTCFVGRPNPSFEYMRSGNRAPAGFMAGEDCIGFNRANIRVKRINNRWKIVDGNHWMFDFGNKKAEAIKSFRIIKKYRFNKSCYIGRPGPSFSYLRK